MLMTWAASEAVERVWMRREHVASLVPPLTRAPAVSLRCSNATTLWLAWDAVPRDAQGRLCDATFVLSSVKNNRRAGRDRPAIASEPRVERTVRSARSPLCSKISGRLGPTSLLRSVPC